MSGDYSRYGFDPSKDYSGVLLQQGRPLTDRDWNDETVLSSRRIQAGTFDTLGQAVVPATTPHGFAITFDAGGHLQIGQGRLYVDGLLVENHGTGTATWDPALAETHGASPTPYTAQIYLPNPPALPAATAAFRAASVGGDPPASPKSGLFNWERMSTSWILALRTGSTLAASWQW